MVNPRELVCFSDDSRFCFKDWANGIFRVLYAMLTSSAALSLTRHMGYQVPGMVYICLGNRGIHLGCPLATTGPGVSLKFAECIVLFVELRRKMMVGKTPTQTHAGSTCQPLRPPPSLYVRSQFLQSRAKPSCGIVITFARAFPVGRVSRYQQAVKDFPSGLGIFFVIFA